MGMTINQSTVSQRKTSCAVHESSISIPHFIGSNFIQILQDGHYIGKLQQGKNFYYYMRLAYNNGGVINQSTRDKILDSKTGGLKLKVNNNNNCIKM